MGTYICSKCGCIDNTACGGNFWSFKSKSGSFKDDYANKNALCVECTPGEYNDGSVNKEAGKWHNIFPKKHWSEYGNQEKLIADCLKNQGNMINAVEYFKNLNTTEVELTKNAVIQKSD